MGFRPHITEQLLPTVAAYYTGATAIDLDVNPRSRTETHVNLLAKYVRDAESTTGRCRFQVKWLLEGPDGARTEAYDTIENSTITVAAGVATVGVYQCVRDLHAGLTTLWTLIEIPIRRHAVALKVEPAEAGDTENPGTVWFYVEGLS